MRRHMAHPFRRAPAAYSQAAVDTLLARLPASAALVLDSGCGTGESTIALARRHPHALVAGIDQSAHRLVRGTRRLGAEPPGHALLLRADAADVWALLAGRGVRLAHHYLLYPNPWPKAQHLQRRWHGHPRWPALLALGGRLELRTNWDVYAQEFAQALRLSGYACELRAWQPDEALTPFERKYAASGHALWRVRADLGD